MNRKFKYLSLFVVNAFIVYYITTLPVSLRDSTKITNSLFNGNFPPDAENTPTNKPAFENILYKGSSVSSANQNKTSALIFKHNDFLHDHHEIDTLLTRPLYLRDDEKIYFVDVGEKECFVHGTDFSQSNASSKDCACVKGYHGKDCGIPNSAWVSYFALNPDKVELKRRKVPRRVIQGLVVNHEFDMTEIRLHEMGDVIDAYIIGESNFSTFGDSKPLRFREKFKNGFLAEFRHKILYVFQELYPEEAYKDGWVADSYIRTHMSLHGLPKIQNTRPDDLFLLFDADEIPYREVVLFLKLYDGYPEPLSFALRWSIFGFFWKIPSGLEVDVDGQVIRGEKMTTIFAGTTLAFLKDFYHNDSILIRRNLIPFMTDKERNDFQKSNGHMIVPWSIGSELAYAGHHCSWCMTPEDIKIKLITANREDKPRWGDYPAKLDLKYIENLIKTGTWFDDYEHYTVRSRDEHYAPKYVLDNWKKYQRLVENPYT